jgi:hypothetical protein
MIWLASFPRSGNTFVRNILYDVYGIESSAFHRNPEIKFNADYASFPVVKTHLPPEQLEPADKAIRSVYLVRDGRDCVVSLAHQRSDLIAPGSDFQKNLEDAIRARGGSFFGGWSANVEAWLKRADLIIRFEDLIKRPIAIMEKLRYIIDLPRPDIERLPSFEKLRGGESRYGRGNKENVDYAKLFFRRGKPGGWQDDMDAKTHDLFWASNGSVMEQLGYHRSGEIAASLRPQPGFELEEGVLIRKELSSLGKIIPTGDVHNLIKNRIELLSIHIPKTAGTSFRNTLRKVYGAKHVARIDIEHKTQIRVNEKLFTGKALNRNFLVVHGHFRPVEFRKWFEVDPEVKVITWVRDPVQRVISNYFYLSDMLAKYLDEGNRGLNILSKMQRSLVEYAAAPVNRNRMARFLKGMLLEDLDFVGVVEHYEEDIKALAETLGWVNPPVFHHNTGALPKVVDPEVVQKILRFNQKDVELYNRALELRSRRVAHG